MFGSGNQKLKLFFASDIHGSELVFRKFLNAAKFYEVDLLIFGGDLTGKAMLPFIEYAPGKFSADVFGTRREVSAGSELLELEQFVRDRGSYPYRTTPDEMRSLQDSDQLVSEVFGKVMRESTEKWITMADERLRNKLPCIMMPGNDDERDVKELLAQGDWIVDGESQVVNVQGYQIASLGWSTITPWSSPREVNEDGMLKMLDKLCAQLAPDTPTILNLHDPPAESGLDLAYKMTADMKVDMAGGQAMLAPVGSKSVRATLERYQPVLSLHGHIHESKGSAKIGKTTAVNAGSSYTEGVLQGAIISLKGEKVAGVQLVSG